MIKEAIYHKIDSDYAYALDKNTFVVKLRTKKNDVKEVTLIYMDKYKVLKTNETYSALMKKVASDDLFDYYEAIVNLEMLSICYFFMIKGFDDEVIYYGNYLFQNEAPKDGYTIFTMPGLREKDIFDTPSWAKNAIVYQIFPERFSNGDPSISPKELEPWDSTDLTWHSNLGGDLRGIINKLPYIEELGVNTIYLTPVFKSSSNHKYNIFDYYEIDPHFGDKETFKELVNEAHKRNIKIILDAVFNHCGVEFFAFQDVLEKGEDSKYKNWFNIKEYPVKLSWDWPAPYDSFAYASFMPKLMTKNEEVLKYLIDVAVYWIREADIDGWRLDVSDEIDHYFWKQFREAVKKEKEDVLIIGELWYDTSSWLKGDEYDTTMNYLFLRAVKEFVAFGKMKPSQLDAKLGWVRGNYHLKAYEMLWNLIGSHDTARFLTECDGNVDKMKLAVLMQLTYTGVPMLYYGDEIGMTGGEDPHCRRGMVWDEDRQNKELLDYYKKLIAIRKEYEVLNSGDLETVIADDENSVYGFRRSNDYQIIDVYVNNGENDYMVASDFGKGNRVKELISGKEYDLENGEKVIVSSKNGVIIYYI